MTLAYIKEKLDCNILSKYIFHLKNDKKIVVILNYLIERYILQKLHNFNKNKKVIDFEINYKNLR